MRQSAVIAITLGFFVVAFAVALYSLGLAFFTSYWPVGLFSILSIFAVRAAWRNERSHLPHVAVQAHLGQSTLRDHHESVSSSAPDGDGD